MADEQLYGREATEQAQGYQPMPEPVADKPDPELEQAQAIERIIDRDPPSPIIERQYVRQDDDSKPQPDNRTIELDRAAKDLAENRETEAAIAAIERDLELANQIDEARREGLGQSVQAQQPEAQQPEAQQQQTQPQQQSAPADVDPELQSLLSHPKILSALTDHYSAAQVQVNAAVSQAAAKADAAVNQAAQWAHQNAEIAAAAILARSELQGIAPGQLPGALQALAKANPEAAAQIRQQLGQVQMLTAQAHEAQRVAQQRQAALFHQYGAAQDQAFDASLAGESPETVMAIKTTSLQILREGGLSDVDIAHHWNSSPLLRSVQGQQILADAARWRLAKAGIKPAPKPVPQVNRPGSSVDRPAAADRDAFALEQRFGGGKGPLSAKEAAQLVIGRRARSR